MKAVLTEQDKAQLVKLKKCRFYPATFDKRFVNSIGVDGEFTEIQVSIIRRLFHKYRGQIAAQK